MSKDRDQLWAEAALREASGESIRLDPSLYDAATEVQASRRVGEPWKDTLEAKLGAVRGKIRSEDLWALLGIPAGQRTQNHNEQFGAVVRELGFDRTKLRFGGDPEWCYVRGPSPWHEIAVVFDAETRTARVANPLGETPF